MDLRRGLELLCGSTQLHASEAVASLLAAFRLWLPRQIEVTHTGDTVRICGPGAPPLNALDLITRHVLLPPAQVHGDVIHLALGWSNLLRLPGVEVRFASEQAEIILTGLKTLDLACLRRRLRLFPISILVNGEPLPLVGSTPSSPEFLWEGFDLAQPFAAPPFAGWSAGPARVELGSDQHRQLQDYRRGHVQVIGRFFSAESGVELNSYHNPRSDWLFRASLAQRMSGPACGAACSLESKPRSRSRWIAVVDGFALNAVEMPQMEPGWRIWIAAAPSSRETDMRTTRERSSLEARALVHLEWARCWKRQFDDRLQRLRRELRA